MPRFNRLLITGAGGNLGRVLREGLKPLAQTLRINSCYEKPADRRHLATWLSFRDLVQLVERCLVSERIGYTVVYGISDNREAFFSNHKVAHLGYRPEDSAEDFRAEVEAKVGVGDPFDPAVEFVGGFLVPYGHPDEEERIEV